MKEWSYPHIHVGMTLGFFTVGTGQFAVKNEKKKAKPNLTNLT